MKKGIANLGLCGLLLCVMPGCWRAVDWAKGNFYQGEPLEQGSKHINSYIKSVRVHDLLNAQAIFDALWLSDEARRAYVDLHVMRYGKSEEQRNALLCSQLEENKQYISLYVLSSYEEPLCGDRVEWGLFLCLNGRRFTPIELKVVDLVPEYRAFFGKKFNQFKVAYVVKFDVSDCGERPLTALGFGQMALYFRSMDKEVCLEW